MAAPARPLSRFWEWGRSIVGVGRNYAEHAREMGETPPCRPLLFLKPASAYVRPGSPVQRPYYCRRLHPEPELAVVLGRRTQGVSRDDAMRYVAGYALCLDMTARDAQDTCKAQGLPWTLAKSFDTSCPVSDFVPKEHVADPHRLRLWLKVNGQLRQEGDTADMLFSVPELISYISEIITLHEGDVILTGTPPGVAAVEEHDELEAGIHGLVSMHFTVVQQRLGA